MTAMTDPGAASADGQAQPWRPYRSLATAYLFQVALEDPGAPSPDTGAAV
jgi:3-methyladenine DNA glycosylase/8-oxoguanine DNA glycosylase